MQVEGSVESNLGFIICLNIPFQQKCLPPIQGETEIKRMMCMWKCPCWICSRNTIPPKLVGGWACERQGLFQQTIEVLDMYTVYMHSLARDYVKQIEQSQKGRPHPDKQAHFFHSSYLKSCPNIYGT